MIETLAWDSEHFGTPIGRVNGSTVSEDEIRGADAQGLRCLYLLLDAADIAAVGAAENLGFRLTDLRITLGRGLAATPESDQVGARDASAADLLALEPLAASAHVDSRFFSDPRFGRDAAARLYVRWLQASVAGELADTVLVVDADDRPAGYITGRSHGDGVAEIGLFAVSEWARGRGLGSRLLSSYLVAAARQGNETMTVVTQGANLAAQRVYQRVGFRTLATELWLHRWAAESG